MNQYSKYLLLKSSIEDLFGSEAWYALKESNHIPTWKKYIEKTLKAVQLSINDTVEIYDEDWLSEIDEVVSRGLDSVKIAKNIDEIIAALAGSLIQISFLQIGYMPRRKGKQGKYSLRKGNWCLNGFRSVIYLQTKKQQEDLFWGKQRKELGFEKQMGLHSQYSADKTSLSYKEWCSKQNEA